MNTTTQTEFYANGRDDYDAGVNNNPYPEGTAAYDQWDRGYWDRHNESADTAETSGIEDGYGDYWDMDAVSQGFYDDDPSPYSGTYSED